MPYNLDRIKVTIKTNRHDNEGIFHIDTLDLYQARSREAFSEACAKYLKVKSSDVMADLNVLIGLLEKERVEMLKEKNKVEVKPMSDIEKQEALDVLADKDLVKRIIEDFDRIGLVGESKNKLIGYLSVISRLLPDPMGLLILSRSGAGKTSLQDAVCKFVPEESLIQYTRLTGQSLFYRDKNALKNKVLAIEEEEGMTDALYSIRTLQSSQKLSIASTRTDAKT
ncbi:DNA primase, partial [Patescibacteria group bacterium]|nr:DNA primase [Patescibacteria group bacterium]